MADYGARISASQPSAQLPTALNPRLELVRDNLAAALKMLAELRARLGVLEPPDIAKPEPPTALSAAGTVMDLLAQSARLTTVLRETLEQVG